jgi:3-deoxy-manno-octulosonate cytidylyltransferase (CMP-KDO synthetase)
MTGVLVVIPARYASVRYPGKPLVKLGGKTLIHRTWDVAMRAKAQDDRIGAVVVATEDSRIMEEVVSFGGAGVFTRSDCRNGTERCAEVITRDDFASYDLVVNLQGDSPLSDPGWISRLISGVGGACGVTTPVILAPPFRTEQLRDLRRARLPAGETTAVFDPSTGRALYFSKEVLPWGSLEVHVHVGMYCYTRPSLHDYIGHRPGHLEQAEGLEQLRFLEFGSDIRCIEVPEGPHWELNNPGDEFQIENQLRLRGLL